MNSKYIFNVDLLDTFANTHAHTNVRTAMRKTKEQISFEFCCLLITDPMHAR